MITVLGIPLLVSVETIISDLQQVCINNGNGYLAKRKDAGDGIQVSCPFHKNGQENRPSCGILKKDKKTGYGKTIPAGTYNCFTCGSSGTLEEFVSHLLGYNDAGEYGYRWLVSHYAAVAVVNRPEIDLGFDNKTQATVNVVTEEELDSYRYIHPYMYKRGLTEELINFFDVGYDKKTDSITFPVKDLTGSVRYIQRRSVNGKIFKNDNNVNKGLYVYGLFEAKQFPDRKIVITESPIDALNAWKYGYAGVATCGLPVTNEQVKILENYPAREYIVASDDDFAGHVAASKLAKMNKILWRMTFNGKKDLSDMTEDDWKNKKTIFLT